MNQIFIMDFIVPLLFTFLPILIFAYCFQDSFLTLFVLMILDIIESGYIFVNISNPISDVPLMFLMAVLELYIVLKMIEINIANKAAKKAAKEQL